jgi:hypothetical protein
MTAQDQAVSIAHSGAALFGSILDETSFERATADPVAFQAGWRALATPQLTLRAYAVAVICINDK